MRLRGVVLGLIGLIATAVLIVACGPAAAPTPVPAATPTKAASPGATSAATAAGGDLALGKTVFDTNCAVCHPGGGAGVGPSIKGK